MIWTYLTFARTNYSIIEDACMSRYSEGRLTGSLEHGKSAHAAARGSVEIDY